MGKNRVFFPQQALDSWLEQGRIALVDDEMTLKPDGQRYRLTSAIRIMEEVAEGTDPHGLVGKVKTIEQIAELGGDHQADSLVLGDNAYQVIEGFLGDANEEQERAAVASSVERGIGNSLASAARAATGEKTSSDDANPLMRFLLGKPS
jgi:hypothetical protein